MKGKFNLTKVPWLLSLVFLGLLSSFQAQADPVYKLAAEGALLTNADFDSSIIEFSVDMTVDNGVAYYTGTFNENGGQFYIKKIDGDQISYYGPAADASFIFSTEVTSLAAQNYDNRDKRWTMDDRCAKQGKLTVSITIDTDTPTVTVVKADDSQGGGNEGGDNEGGDNEGGDNENAASGQLTVLCDGITAEGVDSSVEVTIKYSITEVEGGAIIKASFDPLFPTLSPQIHPYNEGIVGFTRQEDGWHVYDKITGAEGSEISFSFYLAYASKAVETESVKYTLTGNNSGGGELPETPDKIALDDILSVSTEFSRTEGSETNGTLNYTLTLNDNAAEYLEYITSFEVTSTFTEDKTTVNTGDFVDNEYKGVFGLSGFTKEGANGTLTVTADCDYLEGSVNSPFTVPELRTEEPGGDENANSGELTVVCDNIGENNDTQTVTIKYTLAETANGLRVDATFDPMILGLVPKINIGGTIEPMENNADSYFYIIPTEGKSEISFSFYLDYNGGAQSSSEIKYTLTGEGGEEPQPGEPEGVSYSIVGQINYNLTLEGENWIYEGPVSAGTFQIKKSEIIDGVTVETYYGPETTENSANHINDAGTWNCKVSEDYWDLSATFTSTYSAAVFTFNPKEMTLTIAPDKDFIDIKSLSITGEPGTISFSNGTNTISWDWGIMQTNAKEGKVTFSNAYIKENAKFRFMINTWDWNESPMLIEGTEGASDKNIGFNDPQNGVINAMGINSFFIFTGEEGTYDIIVDFSQSYKNPVVTITEHVAMEFDPTNLYSKLSFWEGNVYYALGGKDNGNVDKVFEYTNKHIKNSERDWYIYQLNVTKQGEIEPRVSQMWLELGFYKAFDNDFGLLETNPDKRLYYNVHSNNTLVDVVKTFWCGNSRIEAGITINDIYLIYDANARPGNSETPFKIIFASEDIFDEDGNIKATIHEQKPLNSDSYSIELIPGGAIYDALKGTQEGHITIPFNKHHIAKEGYSINLGKEITVTGDETFSFYVNSELQKANFNVTSVYNSEADLYYNDNPSLYSHIDGSSKPGGLTFNKIVLLVNEDPYGNFNEYQLCLVDRNNEPYQFFRNGYTDSNKSQEKNPQLKIWNGNNYTWGGLYDKSVDEIPFTNSGNVKMYEFKPQMSSGETIPDKDYTGKKTNIYYLDLPDGVEIKDFEGEGAGKFLNQFNILDNEGYDISTVFQGSQVIYPDEWWCVNPSLGFEDPAELLALYGIQVSDADIDAKKNGTLKDDYSGDRGYRIKDGYFFPPLPDKVKGGSEVDLCWGVDDTPKSTKTIYGITLFKIMGEGYDVYAKKVKQRPFYYLYANSKLEKAGQFEKTSPIVLAVKNAEEVFGANDVNKLTQYTQNRHKRSVLERATDKNNDKGYPVTYYNMTLAKRQLDGNDDLNYVLRAKEQSELSAAATAEIYEDEANVTFKPASRHAFEFVDVNGVQTWDAYGAEDMLSPNTWSNYYSTVDEDANDLMIKQTEIEYFRLVMATNPDVVRYQLLSEEAGLESEAYFHYDSQDPSENSRAASDESIPVNHEDAIWMYPASQLVGNFFWGSTHKEIEISLSVNEGQPTPLAKIQIKKDADGKVELDGKGNPTFQLIGDDDQVTDIPSDKIEVTTSSDAFLEEGEYLFRYTMNKFFVDPEWTITATVKYTKEGADPTMLTAKVPVADLPIAGIKEVQVKQNGELFSQNPFYLENRDSYYAQLEWLNGEHKSYPGMPRNYQIKAKERDNNNVSEIVLYENMTHSGFLNNYEGEDSYFTIHDDPEYYYWVEGDLPKDLNAFTYHDDNATKLVTGVDEQKVWIRFTVTPIFHYAIPMNANSLIVLEDEEGLDNLYSQKPAGSAEASARPRKVAAEASQFKQKVVLYADGSNYVDVPYSNSEGNVATGIDGVTAEADFDGPVEIYTLQGVKVNGNPAPGIYIIRQGSKSYKTVIR